MKKLLITWLLSAVTLLISTKFVAGAKINGFLGALWVAIILGLLNALVKPVLEFFSAPLIFLTLGLFSFVVSAAVIYLAASLTNSFEIQDFWTAIKLAVVLTILNWIVDLIF